MAPRHKVPSRFRDQQYGFEVKSQGMVVIRNFFGITFVLLDDFGSIFNICRLKKDIFGPILDIFGSHLSVGYWSRGLSV